MHSSGADIQFSRPGFKIYADWENSSGAPPWGDTGGWVHYASTPIGEAKVVYNTTSAFTQAGVEAGVDWAAGPAFPGNQSWRDTNWDWTVPSFYYVDIEVSAAVYEFSYRDATSSFNGNVGNCISAISDLKTWYSNRWGFWGDSPVPKIACYGGSNLNGLGSAMGFSHTGDYLPFNTESTGSDDPTPSFIRHMGQSLWQMDNDICGQYCQSYFDAAVPEMYTWKSNEYTNKMDVWAQEKRRLKYQIKLLPLIWPFQFGMMTYDLATAIMEYAIRIPEVDGIAYWAVSGVQYSPALVAPNYADNMPWMRACFDFATKYGLSRGNPF